jgi:hypothetical protein
VLLALGSGQVSLSRSPIMRGSLARRQTQRHARGNQGQIRGDVGVFARWSPLRTRHGCRLDALRSQALLPAHVRAARSRGARFRQRCRTIGVRRESSLEDLMGLARRCFTREHDMWDDDMSV